jgi:hypothetical protein
MSQAQQEAEVDEKPKAAGLDGPLGVFVAHAASKDLLEGLLDAAARAGVEVTVFFMDEAVTLLVDRDWVDKLEASRLAACDLSARRYGVELPERIVAGGQYQNALMVSDAARVVSL